MFHTIFNLPLWKQFGSYPLSSCFLCLCCSACPLCAILHVNVVSFRCVATWRRWPASPFLWSKLLIVSCIISCSWCVETVGDPSWDSFNCVVGHIGESLPLSFLVDHTANCPILSSASINPSTRRNYFHLDYHCHCVLFPRYLQCLHFWCLSYFTKQDKT